MQKNNKPSLVSSGNNEETTLDLIAKNIDDIIWKMDIDSMRFTYVSPSVFSIRGYTPQEVMEDGIENSCHPDDLKSAIESVKALFYDETRNLNEVFHLKLEMRQTKKEGGYVWLEVKLSIVLNEKGEPIQAVGVSRDISDSKKETKDLLKSLEREKFFADIIRHSSQAIGIGYPDGKGILLNQAAYNLLGYTEHEMKQISWIDDLTPEKWIEEETNILKEGISEKKTMTYRKEYIHKSGRIFPVELLIHPQFDDNGELNYFLAFITDITEIEKTRSKLKQTSERFELALKGANDGLWDWRVGNEKVYLSPRYLNMLGYVEGELDFSLSDLLALIHADDIDRVEQSHTDFINSNEERTEMQFRIQHKKGFYVPVLSRIYKVIDTEGKAIRIVGTNIDLTETLQMQQKIEEGEARYKLLFENSNIGIAITSDNGEILESNVTLKQMFGVPSNSTDKLYALDFYSHQEDRAHFLELLDVGGEVKSFIFLGKKLDQSEVWLSMSSRRLEIDGKLRIVNALNDITQQVLSEQKLKDSEERFKQLSILTLEGIMIHEKGLILDVNESFINLSGYLKKELLHKDFFTLCMPDQSFHTSLLNDSDLSSTVEIEIKTKEEKTIPVEVNSRTTRFKGRKVQVTSFHDISNRLETESNIKKLSTAVEQSGHSIIITDKKGIIEYVNPQFVKMYEFGLLECLGKPISIIDSGFHRPEYYDNLWHQINEGQVWKGEFLNQSKNGKKYWVSSTISPIKDREGNMTHYLSIMDDITQKKKFEKELIEAKKNAEKSDQLKSAFLANMSHEIRTPLNGIIGFTDLLNDPEEIFSSDEISRYLGIISANGQLLLHLVNDIIDISKIESGQLHISVQDFAFSEVLQKLENSFENSVKDGVELRIQHIDNDLNLKTDFTRVVQVFNNLISNALKFTDVGYVNIGFEEEERHLKVCIEDTGCGISEEAQKIIFDRFAQGRPINDQLLGGTGLGLSITKGLVKLLGGEIDVESVEGEGSVFCFRILKSMKKK